MGIHALVRNNKKTLKVRKLNRWHRAQKAEKKKRTPAKDLVIEDVHLFSDDQLKNKLRNPRNNIAITGKKRNRVRKRLRHNLREKSGMEVDTKPAKSPKNKKAAQSAANEEMQDDDDDPHVESTTVIPEASVPSSSSSSTKKKRRGKKKNKKSGVVIEDVDMKEDL